MKGTLSPQSYTCSEHGNDLTTDVADRVSSDPTLVTDLGFSFRRKNRRSGAPFLVVVRCPGRAGSGHDIEFKGTLLP